VRVGLDGRIDRIYALREPPDAVAIGSHGAIYYTIADEDDRVVWRWDPTTKTSARFAGRLTGAREPCGQPGVALATCPIDDGAPATSVSLLGVSGLAVDAQGRLLVADTEHYLIRRVELDGTMSHIAGTGVYCFAINPTSNCAQPGLAAADTPISPPSFVASSHSDGAIWFTVGRALYRVTASGSLALVFAPSTKSVLSPPSIDAHGRAVVGYWPDGRTGQLVRVSPAGGAKLLIGRAAPCVLSAETYACGDGGFAPSAAIGRQVTSVAVTPSGDIYFTDQGGEVRFIPVPGRPPSRLALALPGPKTVRPKCRCGLARDSSLGWSRRRQAPSPRKLRAERPRREQRRWRRDARDQDTNHRFTRHHIPWATEALQTMGREGIEPSTLGLRVPCSTS
jgi:hypothetical protein